MFKSTIIRQVSRASTTAPRVSSTAFITRQTVRGLRTTPARFDKSSEEDDNDRHDALTTAGKPGAFEHEGQFSRTDKTIRIEHPEESQMPSSLPVQGRGGSHYRRTLATFSLEGRVGVVTGGARGLGLVMAQALVVSGADVAIVDLNKEEATKSAELLVETFRKENPDAEHVPTVTAHYADVSSPDSVNESISEIIGKHGKIDHLVTSAGFTDNIDAIDYPYERLKKLWGVNVDGTYLFSTAVARHLMDRGVPGSIVMIGSMSGSIVNVPQPQAPYNASKAAVRHLASSFAVEWAHAGIRVNCISPGYMLTALTKKILDENPVLAEKWTSLIPQGKMGRPEDLMGAVTFLLSDASGYVTGADLRVDGGYTLT
ncbi:NAD(P)-binding protein [Dissoconium aciculare CBS 342.82]|uniref:NADP-dependent mannitol dehydrogenase n=1 Tax=Dissoconium aciculare CBS 342.82 TaxID=1314786 RepID=A0A6J3M3J0_9PEZI|nr:NAD(P)-binding protein [Dissoconium aciculare CBS 342.82]KAF1822069.1 NAD(P)-binding protein [Dissoconium aciculare CBS 342.82]